MQRATLLKIIKSLDLLHNKALARDLNSLVLQQLERHYQGSDKQKLKKAFSQALAFKRPAAPIQKPAPRLTPEDYKTRLETELNEFFSNQDYSNLQKSLAELGNMGLTQQELIAFFSCKHKGYNLLELALPLKDPAFVKAVADAMQLISCQQARAKLLEDTSANTTRVVNIAVSYQDVASVEIVLQLIHSLTPETQVAFLKKNPRGGSAIFLAAQEDLEPCLDAILKAIQHLSPQQQSEILQDANFQGRSALYVTAQKNHLDCAKTLLAFIHSLPKKQKYNLLNAKDTSSDCTALWSACYNRHNDIALAILHEVALLEPAHQYKILKVAHANGVQIMMMAAEVGHLQVMDKILSLLSGFSYPQKIALLDTPAPNLISAFVMAASKGHTDIVKSMLAMLLEASSKNRAQLFSDYDSQGFAALIGAIEQGHIETAKAILACKDQLSDEEQQRLLSSKTGKDFNPLMVAARFGQLELLKLMVKQAKAYGQHFVVSLLTACDDSKRNALGLAVYFKHQDVAEYLLEVIASFKEDAQIINCIDTPNENGYTALDIAVEDGNTDLVQAILAPLTLVDDNLLKENYHIIDPSSIPKEQLHLSNSPLCKAAKLGHSHILNHILDALFRVEHNKAELSMLILLIEQAIEEAASNDHNDLVSQLNNELDKIKQQQASAPIVLPSVSPKPIDMTNLDKAGLTTAVEAYFNEERENNLLLYLENLDAIGCSEQELLALFSKQQYGRSLLEFATFIGDQALVEKLLEKIALFSDNAGKISLINPAARGQARALSIAASQGDLECLKALLTAFEQFSLDEQFWLFDDLISDSSALVLACEQRHRRCFKALLKYIKRFSEERQVSLLNSTINGKSALLLTIQHDQNRFFKALIKAISKLDSRHQYQVINNQDDEHGVAPLLLATLKGQVDKVYTLLGLIDKFDDPQLKINAIHTKNNDGAYPLLYAAQADEQQHQDCIKALLAAISGFSDEEKLTLMDSVTIDNVGSPISVAAQKGNALVVEMFLQEINRLDDTQKQRLLDSKEPRGYAALIDATVFNHPAVVDVMLTAIDSLTPLQQQAFLAMKNNFGYSAFMLAAAKGYPLLLSKLLDAASKISSDLVIKMLNLNSKHTVLNHATDSGNIETVKTVLSVMFAESQLDDSSLESFINSAKQRAETQQHHAIAQLLALPLAQIKAQLAEEESQRQELLDVIETENSSIM